MFRRLRYSHLWNQVLEPSYETLRGKQLPQISKFINQSQFYPRDQIEDMQWAKIESLLHHAKTNVPFYSRFFDQNDVTIDDICSSRTLAPLPIINRSMIKANSKDFISLEEQPGTYCKCTGGSSGEPLEFSVCGQSDQWRNAMTRRGYGWAGAFNGRRCIHLWSRDIFKKTTLNKLKHDIHCQLMQQKHFVNFDLSTKRLSQLCQLIDSYGPKVLVSYTTSAEVLARYALDQGWRPRQQLDSIVVAAEKLFDTQRAIIEEAFGCKVFESYGSREFMLIAMECEQHCGLHVSSENLFLEIVKNSRSAPRGECGHIVITDLHNYAHPFIRYQNDDLATWSEKKCTCGRQLPLLQSIDGRTMDIIRGVDGRPLTGVFFPHLFKEFSKIRQFQVVQKTPRQLIIRLILDEKLEESLTSQIAEQILKVLPGMKLDFVQVDALEKNKSGKTRVTIGLPESN